MNDIKSEYRKARRRVQSRIYRLRKKGYDTSSIKLPNIPKRVTEGSIRRLESSFTPKKLKEKAIKPSHTTPMEKPTEQSTPVEYDAPDEFDVLVDAINTQIDRIPNMPIPKFSRAVGAICSDEFNAFVNSIDEEAKGNAIETLRSILSYELLSLSQYESDQIAEAKAWGAELNMFAMEINSSVMMDVANEIVNGDVEMVDTEEMIMPWDL